MFNYNQSQMIEYPDIIDVIQPDSTNTICFVYILLLVKEKYYVGETQREFHHRIGEHFNQRGSEWTKKYRPERVLKLYRTNIKYFELIQLIQMVNEKGIQNVRGNIFSRLLLSLNDYFLIEKVIRNEKRTCLACNMYHYISLCRHKKELSNLEKNIQEVEERFKKLHIPCDHFSIKDYLDSFSVSNNAFTKAFNNNIGYALNNINEVKNTVNNTIVSHFSHFFPTGN